MHLHDKINQLGEQSYPFVSELVRKILSVKCSYQEIKSI